MNINVTQNGHLEPQTGYQNSIKQRKISSNPAQPLQLKKANPAAIYVEPKVDGSQIYDFQPSIQNQLAEIINIENQYENLKQQFTNTGVFGRQDSFYNISRRGSSETKRPNSTFTQPSVNLTQPSPSPKFDSRFSHTNKYGLLDKDYESATFQKVPEKKGKKGANGKHLGRNPKPIFESHTQTLPETPILKTDIPITTEKVGAPMSANSNSSKISVDSSLPYYSGASSRMSIDISNSRKMSLDPFSISNRSFSIGSNKLPMSYWAYPHSHSNKSVGQMSQATIDLPISKKRKTREYDKVEIPFKRLKLNPPQVTPAKRKRSKKREENEESSVKRIKIDQYPNIMPHYAMPNKRKFQGIIGNNKYKFLKVA
ncbi:hypothetical protein HDV06_001363 [Boothiomyces sp. JEL0866]|nr:hypothetical protein HDV06_001363 [Boothiomyces sp. JEL0866]